MSPEQVKGENADARSDVHALGVVLYEMLAGARPYESSSYATVVHAIVYQDPEPIARRRPEVPRAVVRVIERCMRKDPADRYVDGSALHAELEPLARALESGESVREGLGTLTSDIARSGRHALRKHRRWAVAAVALATLMLAGFLSWTLVPAVRNAVGARFDRMLPAAALTPFELYKSGTADLDRYFVAGRVDRAVESFQKAVTADPGYAPGYVGLAEAYWRRYRENRDEAWLRQSVGNARQAASLDPQLARAHVALGLALTEGRSYEEARAAFDLALRLDPLNAQAHRGLGAIAMANNQPAAADSEFTRAIALAPQDWEIRSQRGVLHLTYGRYQDALADFETTVRLSPDNPYTYRNVGGAQHMLGRFADAAASFQKSIEIKPDPVVYSNLGTIYFFQGLYPQAVSAFEKSIQLGPNHATIWRNLGDAYRRVPGKEADASQAYLRSAQLLREELKRQPGDVVLTSELALCLARRSENTEAWRIARSVDAGARRVAEAGYALTLAYEAMGARDDALSMLRDALAAGYPRDEIQGDPELIALRQDSRYHRLLASTP
jgi:serine/threonine-protein kinase